MAKTITREFSDIPFRFQLTDFLLSVLMFCKEFRVIAVSRHLSSVFISRNKVAENSFSKIKHLIFLPRIYQYAMKYSNYTLKGYFLALQ